MARGGAALLALFVALPTLISAGRVWDDTKSAAAQTKSFVLNTTAAAQADAAAMLSMGTNSSEPWFCHGYPCPQFTSETINGTTPFELRTYAKSTWVTRCENNTNLHLALVKGRLPLYSYIRGSNSAHQKLPISSPLVVRITPNTSFSSENNWQITNNFTLGMYINQTESAAGTPTSNATHLTTLEEGVMYVLSFGGYATTASIAENVRKLAAALTQGGYSFDTASFMYAQYDSPARVRQRHNEIWVTEQGHDSAFTDAAMDQQR